MKKIWFLFFIFTFLNLGIAQDEGGDDVLGDDYYEQRNNLEKTSKQLKQPTSPQTNMQVQDNFVSSVMPDMVRLMIQKFLEQNPFSLLSEQEVKNMILSQTKGNPVGDYLEKSPKLVGFLVTFLRDKKALAAFFGVVNKPDKMKKYSYSFLAILILSFVLNLFNKEEKLWKRFLIKLGLTLGLFVANIILFYFFFQDELAPTIAIAKNYL